MRGRGQARERDGLLAVRELVVGREPTVELARQLGDVRRDELEVAVHEHRVQHAQELGLRCGGSWFES